MGCASGKGKAADNKGQKKEKIFDQTLVVLRHSIRCDYEDPSYKDTDEYKSWPFDTSITEKGVTLAQDVAKEMKELNDKAQFAMVVCSPYRRCMQTAAEVTKLLKIPVLVDQEIGEVWEEAMPSDRPPHRSPSQLKEMASELDMEVANPLLPEGDGIKLFGNRPSKHGELVKDGHQRCLVRIQHYIEQSDKTRQNFIIVSHAPAVAAVMNIFEHGQVDVNRLDYCARVIASRSLSQSQAKGELKHDQSVFLQQWQVDFKGIEASINIEANEEDHEFQCQQTEEMRAKRFEKRTKTDALLSQTIKLQKDRPSWFAEDNQM